METAEEASPAQAAVLEQETAQAAPALVSNGKSVLIDPDLDFIRTLSRHGADSYKKCFQCGTCSATCPLSPETDPFPRKEMAWAVWGLKQRLMADPDIWLCHHCNDCSVSCPRSGGPGDVLAAVRRETVIHYAAPRFLARWVSRPLYTPLLLAIPALLLSGALLFRDDIGRALGFVIATGEPIVYSYSRVFPHWFINLFFGLFAILALVACVIGIARFVRVIGRPQAWGASKRPSKSMLASTVTALRKIIRHEEFTSCTAEHTRPISHFLVFFGFIALSAVTFWVITGPINPLLRNGFVYPFSFWSPWKVLANVGGLAVLAGCILMIRDRLYHGEAAGSSSYFDWLFLWTIFAVVVSGFVTEFLHYLRMVPHRHVAYFIHLVFVFALLIYLPYSKFAHLLYRVAAMVYAEHYGRTRGNHRPASSDRQEVAAVTQEALP